MTGYRTGFTGLFDYTEGMISEVKPLAQLQAGYRMVVRDGSRVGLPHWTSYLPRQMPFPVEKDASVPVNITAYLLGSKSLEEPAGVLIDCKRKSYPTSPQD
jgi:hypothetical protein